MGKFDVVLNNMDCIINSYEIMLIVKPVQELIDCAIEKLQATIENNSGIIEKSEQWGQKKLAYEIDNYKEGIYALIAFRATPPAVRELDRVLKIDDNVLRHLIIRKEE